MPEPRGDTAGGSWHIRAATPTDLRTIVAFNRALARETEGRAPEPETLRAGVRALLEDPDLGRYFLAEPDEPAGAGADGAAHPGLPVVGQTMVTFEWSDWRNGRVWWIQSVYVPPDRRRRGVYRALHEHVRRTARVEGGVGIRLYVERENTPARATYRALGLRPSRYEMFEQMWAEPQEG